MACKCVKNHDEMVDDLNRHVGNVQKVLQDAFLNHVGYSSGASSDEFSAESYDVVHVCR